MTRLYPQIRVASIGVSVYGRKIPVVSLVSGPKEVFASAAWHAEEWISACLGI
ncbi:MAG: hypothetical protein K6U74_20410 [Firmicutes bacterium]|nr:hypothetical protein [Bacillota bacterium]